MAFEISRFQFWLTSVFGTYPNVDGAYGAQCWDLAAHFAIFFNLPVVNTTGGNGKWAGFAGTMYRDYPQTPAIEAAYERVSATQPGRAGDLAIWGDSFWYYPATHVAVVIEDGGPTHLRCASLNSSPSRWDNPYPGQSSGPTLDQWLPKQGLLGYLRPRTGLVLQGEIVSEGGFTVSEADRVIKEVKAHINGMLLGPYEWGGRKDNPGLIPHTIENQRLINVGLAENRANFEALPTRIWWATTVKRDGKEIAVIQDFADVGSRQLGQGEVLVEISESLSPEALAAMIPQANAQAFIEALVQLLKPEAATKEIAQ